MNMSSHLPSLARLSTGLRFRVFLVIFLWHCLSAIWLLLEGIPASANEGMDEQREYDFSLSKGIHLYSLRQYREAERYLGEAFKAKPGDPQAGYYLGQTLLRVGRYGDAEERYREVLRGHPNDGRARMGLGMALYHQGRYSDAWANLSAAESGVPDEPLVYYYQGLAAASLQLFPQASEKFMRAGALDQEFARDPQYKRGASFYSQGRPEQAVAEFQRAARIDVSPTQQPSRALPGEGFSSQKRWDLQAALSLQYDSNVVLLPTGVSSPGNNISHKDDFVTVLAGSGEYRFIQDDLWTVGAGYGFYQNIHARLGDFDVRDHTPTLYVQRRFGAAQLRFQYLLDYVTVGGDSFLLSNALLTTVTVPQSERSYTQAFVRYQNKDFKEFELDRSGVNPTRDADNWMIGAMQYLVFPDNRIHLRAGYTFDTDRTGGGDVDRAVPGVPSKSDWSYTGHRFSTGAAFQPWASTKVDLAFDYYRQGYDNPNSFSSSGTTVRSDNIFQLTGTAVRDLRSWLWFAFQYSYTRDDANVAAFSYVRHVVSFTVGGRF